MKHISEMQESKALFEAIEDDLYYRRKRERDAEVRTLQRKVARLEGQHANDQSRIRELENQVLRSELTEERNKNAAREEAQRKRQEERERVVREAKERIEAKRKRQNGKVLEVGPQEHHVFHHFPNSGTIYQPAAAIDVWNPQLETDHQLSSLWYRSPAPATQYGDRPPAYWKELVDQTQRSKGGKRKRFLITSPTDGIRYSVSMNTQSVLKVHPKGGTPFNICGSGD